MAAGATMIGLPAQGRRRADRPRFTHGGHMAELPGTADIVVIGGGVHGASITYHLARKKAGRVVLIEKKFVASGPTGRSTALVRGFYGMDFFTRTGTAAVAVFRDWQQLIGSGDPGFRPVGLLVLAGPDEAEHLDR